ncbi:LLM class flavin-dependent oxidoreductase [[Mycobacterium] nativiensis]|uniref:LLM class flavin-dependent oxidoreductase n=1 Tax=[Mycobacterium] nativiensis TaxID=2855503 RepID=A0ABU5XQB4_9MYCO|nr:LLM class flavin-dependent oxidoreductase [Mycolicibacter sp. MYC340]MEB3030037.1 LLM class flavin-dependent oxidoreductase [Mycolicibacter sp. MYC340]
MEPLPAIGEPSAHTSYGINAVGCGRGRQRFDTMAQLAREAEDAGCAAVWSSELYSRSATVPMAVLAATTSRVLIGSNIAYGVGRSPLMWAAEARDLDELSEGRLILGLGNGTSNMMSNWHGVAGEAPAARMSELITVLRQLWRLHEGPVHHDGRFYAVHIAPGTEMSPPLRAHLPIWIAGVNPAMIRTAGRSADGLIGHPMFTTDYVEHVVRPELATGSRQIGRPANEVAVMGIRICAIDDDEEAARRQAAFAIGQYAASRVYDRLFALHGWSDAQQKIRQAVRDHDVDALVKAVPDAAVDAIAVACTPSDFPSRLVAASQGFDHVDLTAPPWGLSDVQTLHSTRQILASLRALLGSSAVSVNPSVQRSELV